MLNKPEGVVSAAQDKRDTTVVDLVKMRSPAGSYSPPGGWTKPALALCC